MALASAYAISGLSQTEFCSSIYGTLFQEDPVLSDVKRADAQLARDQDRAVRHHPPRWQDVTLRFAAKVLHLSGK